MADQQDLAEIERIAVELANVAGAEITLALGRILDVRYKEELDPDQPYRDPVSEVDDRVEKLIRARLAEIFPSHGIIGEEMDEELPQDSDYVWAIDPVDGTANFVNGFPLFSASIGVLHKGVPVVGALWCATSHALRPGVYHGRQGGTLMFENVEVEPRRNPLVRRRLVGMPQPVQGWGLWETRKTGSAAIECAFVAAGLLEAARFNTPNIWDVAGGIALAQIAGARVLEQGEAWAEFTSFGAPSDLARWKRPLILGHAEPALLLEHLGQ